jgi:hypothetical protein
MAKDRKTLTDADIVSRRSSAGRAGQGASGDADTAHAKSDRDGGAETSARKTNAVKDHDAAKDRDKAEDRGTKS